VQCSSQLDIPGQWLFAGLDARVALGVDRWGRRPRAGAPTPRAVEAAVRVPGHVTVDEYAEGIKQHVSLHATLLLDAVACCVRKKKSSCVRGAGMPQHPVKA
jgi:hypothetical protein